MSAALTYKATTSTSKLLKILSLESFVCTCFPFSDIIRGVIDDVVAGFVVLPNRITVPLTDVDPYELKYPMPDVSECLLIVFTVFLAGFFKMLLPNGPFVFNIANFK